MMATALLPLARGVGVPITSMTGYARAQGSGAGLAWVWEARSVNGRNLETRCRVPPGWDRLENPARTAVASAVRRGNVTLSLTTAQERRDGGLRINRAVLDQVLPLLAELQTRSGMAAPSADGVLRIRGIIEEDRDSEVEADTSALDKAVLATLDQALGGLREARAA